MLASDECLIPTFCRVTNGCFVLNEEKLKSRYLVIKNGNVTQKCLAKWYDDKLKDASNNTPTVRAENNGEVG